MNTQTTVRPTPCAHVISEKARAITVRDAWIFEDPADGRLVELGVGFVLHITRDYAPALAALEGIIDNVRRSTQSRCNIVNCGWPGTAMLMCSLSKWSTRKRRLSNGKFSRGAGGDKARPSSTSNNTGGDGDNVVGAHCAADSTGSGGGGNEAAADDHSVDDDDFDGGAGDSDGNSDGDDSDGDGENDDVNGNNGDDDRGRGGGGGGGGGATTRKHRERTYTFSLKAYECNAHIMLKVMKYAPDVDAHGKALW